MRRSIALSVPLMVLLVATTITANVPLEAASRFVSEEIVRAAIDRASALLQQPQDDNDFPIESMEDLSRDMEELTKGMQRLEELTLHLREKQQRVQEMVQEANARQLQDLVERLEKTYEKEIKLREKWQEISNSNSDDALVEDEDDDEESLATDTVSKDAFDERFSTRAIFEESENKLFEWFLEVVQNEMELFKSDTLKPLDQLNVLESGGEIVQATANKAERCPGMSDIVRKVQQALTNYAIDGIGKVDHAQGAKIVHWLTTDTYIPPPKTTSKLGFVWWRKYIPQDWEKLLPEGWEDWSVDFPSYLYHSLGFLKGDVAPPEAVLQKNTLPGACWPMARQSGQVTLKLAYPVLVEEISIDHASWEVIPEGYRTSAPKTMTVIGYPPCDGDDYCTSLGFDTTDPIEIAQFTYDVDGPSVQTFESQYGRATNDVVASGGAEQEEGLTGDNDESGSCSVEKASCSTAPRIPVAGVTLQVHQNWGNPEFTCIYRVRIHGEPES